MTLSILLIPYLIFFVLWIIFSILIMGKMVVVVKDNAAGGLLFIVYLIGSAIIIGLTLYFASMIEWGSTITLF